MDNRRLDNLARSLATASNRRAFLRGCAAIAAAGVLGVGRGNASAQGVCQPAQPCVASVGTCDAEPAIDGSCICILAESAMTCRRYTCSSDGDCPGGQVCTQADCGDGLGRCKTPCPQNGTQATCPDGQTLCNGHCTDLSSDLVNCGACGTQCAFGGESIAQVCVNGTCQCPAGYPTFCNGTCLDTSSNPYNCGACGNSCNGGTCTNGQCAGADSGGTETQQTAAGGSTVRIISWNCGQVPDLGIEPPANAPFFAAHPVPGCTSSEGAQFSVTTDAGTTLGTCTTSAGYCTVDASGATGTLTVIETAAPAGYAPQAAQQTIPVSQLAAVPVIVINLPANAAAAAPSTAAPAASQGKLPTAGQLAYAIKTSGHWDVWLHEFATSKDTRLTNLPNSDQWAQAWSFDGKRLAYLSDQTDGTNQVWVMDADGANQRQVTHYAGGGQIKAVVWAPDNQSIYVTVADAQGSHLLTGAIADGKLVDSLPAPSGYASVGSNGWLAYVTTSAGHDAIAIANPDLKLQRTITSDDDAAMPSLNAGGTKVAYSVGQPGSRRLFVAPLPQGDPQPVTTPAGDASNPVWAGDDQHLACVLASGGPEQITIVPLDGSAPATVATPPHDLVWYLAWRP